ncbi:unnamed protein product [Oikopleura dioica]|uniref:C1q domain-containing protein n=1 Tax=Oikopleura dioica TaxID=34765 RepID=E4XJ34_OIKDI|nr:unnamed protein product [Oikopleura dioica]CBY37037.1 unnamed protein product [Oikopleura dioica]
MRLFFILTVAVQSYREQKRTYTPYGQHVATSGEFQSYQVSAGRSIHRANTQKQYRFAPPPSSSHSQRGSSGRCKRGPRGYPGKNGQPGPKGEPGVCPSSCKTQDNNTLFSSKTDRAAFAVTLSHDTFNRIGNAVLFDTIVTDSTKSYDSQKGTFTAPISGFYHFSASGTQDDKNMPLHFSIKRGYLDNNNDDVLCSAQSNGKYQTCSCSTTVHLEKGQKVYVSLLKGDLFANRFHYTSFNGFQL